MLFRYIVFGGGDKKEILQKFVLATNPSQLWFLWMLFDVFILFWFLNGFFLKHNVWGAILVMTLYGIGLLGSKLLPNLFQIWTACTYVVFFWVGVKLRQYQDEFKKINYCLLWVVLDVLLFVFLQHMPMDGMIFKVLALGLKLVLHIVGALMSFFVLTKLADKINWKKRRLVRQLSDFSMPVYLFHQQIIYFSIYFFNGRVNPYINALLNFIMAMTVSIIFSALLMKCKATRFAIGVK